MAKAKKITKKELESLQKIKAEVQAVKVRAGDLYLRSQTRLMIKKFERYLSCYGGKSI